MPERRRRTTEIDYESQALEAMARVGAADERVAAVEAAAAQVFATLHLAQMVAEVGKTLGSVARR